MSLTNHERVGKALGMLKEGLGPFIEREMENKYGEQAQEEANRILGNEWLFSGKSIREMDAGAQLKLMWDTWNDIFRQVLSFSERTLVSELRDVRNRWAHQSAFSSDDADRALDSVERLLTAASAPQANEVRKLKMELRQLVFSEQTRSASRRTIGTIENNTNIKPWREIITPHKDVASGQFEQASFAADLWYVHIGEGKRDDEYSDPAEFFRRTYLTESLKNLLINAVKRVSSNQGDPVIQLQTNFGGGKTHSMLALYHLFSGKASAKELLGIEEILMEAKPDTPSSEIKIPTAKLVVLVGNRISPGNPSVKADGTTVNTLWGEIAWQLGGKAAYELIRNDDERATNPGDTLRKLFNEYGPCVILIDEWVAYARQLNVQSNLPAGSFETQFSFAQALTESAKLADKCLLVISLPASDTATNKHMHADDVEVGGQRGREALERLRNVVGRVESIWIPASAEESFEIVRRRLFEPMTDPRQFTDRDVIAKAFTSLYKTQKQEFPSECGESKYEKRIQAAYPIHPEIFDRLYTEWSTQINFQRTRGVLRLMAAVIHSLWDKGDKNPLIMPAHIPIEDPKVRSELTRYLTDNWIPIIEKDVDGAGSLPQFIDSEVANLGKFSACRRVARTIFLGSAPSGSAANRGIEDRQIKLGCVMPGEPTAVFGDALRRLSNSATYLYQDGTRYWYSTQPTVTKLAEDRAEQLKREPNKIEKELEKRLRADLRKTGAFKLIHIFPESSADILDNFDSKLVVLSPEYAYTKDLDKNPTLEATKTILETRGNNPRIYRNTMLFMAPDKTRFQDLDEAIRKYLAWESIIGEKEALDLSPFQVKQATAQRDSMHGTINARIPETYHWLLIPVQAKDSQKIEFKDIKLIGQETLAQRATKKLQSEELMISSIAPSRLKIELDKIPLWRGNHVSIKQLIEDMASYIYLPRLTSSDVLLHAISDGLTLLTWNNDSFAYADSFDEAKGRYIGLRCGQATKINEESTGLLVRPDIAVVQWENDMLAAKTSAANNRPTATTGAIPSSANGNANTVSYPNAHDNATDNTIHDPPIEKSRPKKRYQGSVELDALRVARDAGKIAEEVIANLGNVKIKVTLEIEAITDSEFSEQTIRIVSENGKALKFVEQSFEEE